MPRRLHIGGTIRKDGWEVFNALAGPHVDHQGNANDLTRFGDETFSDLYASHVLEHFDYVGEIPKALREWFRVLAPGGRLLVSVPDMDVLCRLFLERTLTTEQRFFVMRMIFGGHVDKWDYHVVGINEEFLTAFFAHAGFAGVQRVESFGLFDDTSESQFAGRRISVNLIAYKAPVPAV